MRFKLNSYWVKMGGGICVVDVHGLRYPPNSRWAMSPFTNLSNKKIKNHNNKTKAHRNNCNKLYHRNKVTESKNCGHQPISDMSSGALLLIIIIFGIYALNWFHWTRIMKRKITVMLLKETM